MDEAVFEQKIQCAIDGNGRRALAGGLRHFFNQLIGAKGVACRAEQFQDLAARGGEADIVRFANVSRSFNRAAGFAMIVIMAADRRAMRLMDLWKCHVVNISIVLRQIDPADG